METLNFQAKSTLHTLFKQAVCMTPLACRKEQMAVSRHCHYPGQASG